MAIDHGGLGRPNLLYLAHRVPYPPDKGDRIRSYHILQFLSRHARVHLVCLADEPAGRGAMTSLLRICEQVEVVRLGPCARWARALASLASGRTVTEGAFYSPAARATLQRWAGRVPFRAAVASASSMAPYLRDGALRRVPAVVDLVDVDSQKWLDYAALGRGPRAWLYRTEGHRLRCLERDLPDWTRAVTLVSEAEVEIYRRFRPSPAVHAVTNGVDLDYFRPAAAAAGGHGCVFVGALDYPPNVDGARWFCREVWPEVRRRRPGATFALVGRHPTPEVRHLANVPGVELIGTVPDVRPYFAGAAVAVVPLRIARGVQNKVLEALAMGKAVVASPQALDGLGIEPGSHALAASGAAQWADAVAALLADPAARGRLGAAGRRYVEDRHRWDVCLEPFARILGLTPGRVPAGGNAVIATGSAGRHTPPAP